MDILGVLFCQGHIFIYDFLAINVLKCDYCIRVLVETSHL